MSELPPTGPRTDMDAPASESAEGAPPRREFDTRDTQEIPIAMSMRTRSAGFSSTVDARDGAGGPPAPAPDVDAAGEPPASAEGLRSTVLARVRETREELLRLIDRFVEQQDRRERAAQEERERVEQQRLELQARQDAEQRERAALLSRAAVEAEELRSRDRRRIDELEGQLELLRELPAHLAALQTEAVSAHIETTRLRSRATELEAAAQAASRLPIVDGQLQAAERHVARAGAALAALRRATWRLDEASSQTEVLARLLEEATGFASRSALFLVRRPQPIGELRLAAWGACGFTEQGTEHIEILSPTAWQSALDGSTLRGGAELGAPVALASDSAAPLDALIVPFILRDETRALLYVDRFDPDHPFDADALQLLCFVAAHALEVLPLRHKRPAGTLADPAWADEPVAAHPPAPPEPMPAAAVEPAISVTPPAPVSVAAFGAEPPAAEASVSDVEDLFREEPVRAVAPTPPPRGFETGPIEKPDFAELAPLDTVDLGDAVAPLETRVEATTQEVDMRSFGFGRAGARDERDAPVQDVKIADEPEEDTTTGELEAVVPPPPASAAPPASFLPSLFGRSDEPVVTPGRVALDSLLRPAPATPPTPPPPPVDLWKPAPPPARPIAPEPPAAPPPAPAVEAPAPAAPPTAGREVVPPSDIEGPGWAFGRRGGSDEDHAHEEAKRLARLLVSELQLYNEEEIDEGRRQGNVYRFLKEHIDKSRMLYEERVDEKIRRSTDYFREELVKSLAGGDPARLGF